MLNGCFIICWTPFVICLIYKRNLQSHNIDSKLYSLSYILVTMSSLVNPLIYAWKNKDFRSTFAEFLRCRSAAKQSAQGHQNAAFNADDCCEIPVDVIPVDAP